MPEMNYYRLNVQGQGDWYEYGQTALDAIRLTKQELEEANLTHGAITARPAVYGEWDCRAHHFTNDGTHTPHA